MTKRTLEIRGKELPENIRGKNIAPDDLVRITIETIADTAKTKMSALDFIEAADRYEGTRGDGLDVAPFVQSLRGEWDK